jgi:hypothetical protein
VKIHGEGGADKRYKIFAGTERMLYSRCGNRGILVLIFVAVHGIVHPMERCDIDRIPGPWFWRAGLVGLPWRDIMAITISCGGLSMCDLHVVLY